MITCSKCPSPAVYQIGLAVKGKERHFSYTELYTCEYHKNAVSVAELLHTTAWKNFVQQALDDRVMLPDSLSVSAEYYSLGR